MNEYVNRMKAALVSLNTTVQDIHAKIDRNRRTYAEPVAASENAKLETELNQAAENTRAKIDSIHAEAVAAARKWGELKGSDIDATDLRLLEGSFQLSKSHLEDLLFKHQDNSTMLNAIAKYAEDHKVVLDYVPSTEGKLHAYGLMAGSARALLDSILAAHGLAADDVSLAMWGQSGNISHELELALFGIRRDDPAAAAPKTGFGFSFKPVSGR